MSCIHCKYMSYLNNDLSFRPTFNKKCMEPDAFLFSDFYAKKYAGPSLVIFKIIFSASAEFSKSAT